MKLAWEWDPAVIVPLAVTLILYLRGLAKLWMRAGVGRGVRVGHVLCFIGGWLSIVAALVSPLHEFGEHLFTAHMIEHEVLMAIAAPLFALSRPLGIFLQGMPRKWRLALVRWAHQRTVITVWSWLVEPLTATVLHGVAIWVWHVPALLDATLTNDMLHRLQHICFLVTALFFWWAIIRRPLRDYGMGALHVFATMIHTGLLGALLTLAPHVFYPVQTADAPHFGLTPLEDQQLAGLFMWVPGGAIYLLAGLYLLARWITEGAKPRTRGSQAALQDRTEQRISVPIGNVS